MGSCRYWSASITSRILHRYRRGRWRLGDDGLEASKFVYLFAHPRHGVSCLPGRRKRPCGGCGVHLALMRNGTKDTKKKYPIDEFPCVLFVLGGDSTKRPVRLLPPSTAPPARHRPGVRSARRVRWPCHSTADQRRCRPCCLPHCLTIDSALQSVPDASHRAHDFC